MDAPMYASPNEMLPAELWACVFSFVTDSKTMMTVVPNVCKAWKEICKAHVDIEFDNGWAMKDNGTSTRDYNDYANFDCYCSESGTDAAYGCEDCKGPGKISFKYSAMSSQSALSICKSFRGIKSAALHYFHGEVYLDDGHYSCVQPALPMLLSTSSSMHTLKLVDGDDYGKSWNTGWTATPHRSGHDFLCQPNDHDFSPGVPAPGCLWVDDDLLEQVAQHCPNLQVLTLVDCEKVTSAGFRHIESMARLTKLNLKHGGYKERTLKEMVPVSLHGKVSERCYNGWTRWPAAVTVPASLA